LSPLRRLVACISVPGVNYFERPASIILSGAVEQDH